MLPAVARVSGGKSVLMPLVREKAISVHSVVAGICAVCPTRAEITRNPALLPTALQPADTDSGGSD
jgi:hypothetical protein